MVPGATTTLHSGIWLYDFLRSVGQPPQSAEYTHIVSNAAYNITM
jgi:hypothetical protein